MSDLSSVRAWLLRFGLDLKTAVTLVVMCFTAVWGVSIKYSTFMEHMTEIDRTQVEIKESMKRQDDNWNQALKEQTAVLLDQIKNMNLQNALESKTLESRLTTMEVWRSEEQKRDMQEDTAIARIGEQVSETHADMSELKKLFDEMVLRHSKDLP